KYHAPQSVEPSEEISRVLVTDGLVAKASSNIDLSERKNLLSEGVPRVPQSARMGQRRCGEGTRHSASFEHAFEPFLQVNRPGHCCRNLGRGSSFVSFAPEPKQDSADHQDHPDEDQPPTSLVDSCRHVAISLRRTSRQQLSKRPDETHLLVHVEPFDVLPPALRSGFENLSH